MFDGHDAGRAHSQAYTGHAAVDEEIMPGIKAEETLRVPALIPADQRQEADDEGEVPHEQHTGVDCLSIHLFKGKKKTRQFSHHGMTLLHAET